MPRSQRRAARRPRPEVPVAHPYAPPPPESPYHAAGVALMGRLQPPAPPPIAPAFAPAPGVRAGSPGRAARYLVVIVGVLLVGVLAGWYFLRGPGARTLQDLFTAGDPPKEKEPPRVAENTPPPEKKERAPEERKAPPELPKDPPRPEPPPAPAVTFDKQVRPVFAAKCLSCHGSGRKRGGLDMRTIEAMVKGGDSGPSLTPGSPDKSLLWETIATNRMPPGRNKLTAAERTLVRDWIAAGAK